WLEKKRGSPVQICTPACGEEERHVGYAKRMALMLLSEHRMKSEREAELTLEAVRELQGLLGLPEPPRRIEAFDVSNIMGEDAVGSLIVFEDGKPRREAFRRFRVKTVRGPDDPGMIGEVVYRRYRGILERGEEPPGLVLVDGGLGQLGAAVESLRALGLKVPVVGLAKRFENLYTPGEGEPISLPHDSKALLLLRRVRDEAHRFALSYHKKLRVKKLKQSMLDTIPGVGRKRRNELLKHFGSVENLRRATVEEIMGVPGISEKLARRIQEHLANTRTSTKSFTKHS
ncbi:MAG: helix-hairpin-helix domain-containing protein, partial [Candidatus Freyarchaeota archaeon]